MTTTGEISSVAAKKIALPASSSLTISSGAITVTGSNHAVDTESDATTDNLDTINGGADGVPLYLRTVNASRTVVVKNGAGNIACGTNISLDNSQDHVQLKYDGAVAKWLLISYAKNGV